MPRSADSGSTATTSSSSDGGLGRYALLWGSCYCLGIIVSLVIYGVLQEKVMNEDYKTESFNYSVFLVFSNRVFALLFALGMALVRRESLNNKAPLWKYLVVSLSNVYASTCQYEALKYVSFVVQMLGKSFKMMPVMCWGMLINGKRYDWKDWTIAACVTFGVAEFLVTGPTASSHEDNATWKGYLLLLCFLLLDGLTSTMQEKLFREHRTSKYNQMIYINLFSSLVGFLTMAGTNTLNPAFSFFFEHGRFAADSLVLSTSAVSGQFFIVSLVRDFGALAFAATMNVRQVISVIVSYVMYGHYITLPQFLGLCLTTGALFYKVGLSFQQAHKKLEKHEKESDILRGALETSATKGSNNKNYRSASPRQAAGDAAKKSEQV